MRMRSLTNVFENALRPKKSPGYFSIIHTFCFSNANATNDKLLRKGGVNMKWNEKAFSKFIYLSDVRISKNGEKVAYVLTKANIDENRYESTVVVHNLKTGGKAYIKDSSMPRLSPNGKNLIVKRAQDKRTELWLIDLEKMSERKIAKMKNVIDVSWNEDNRRILITGIKKMEDEDFYFEEDIPVWFDAMGFLDSEKRTVLVYDTEAMEVLSEVEVDRFSSAIWHGNNVIVTSPHRGKGKIQMWRYDIYKLHGDKKDKVFEDVSFKAAHSNGRYIAFLGKEKALRMSEHSYVYIWDEKELTLVNGQYGLNSWNVKLDKDSNTYFSVDNSGKMELWKVSPSGKRSVIFGENAWVTDLDVSEDGKIAFLVEDEVSPPELYLWNEGLQKLSSYNSEVLKILPTRRAKHFRFKSIDLEIDGWYIKPDLKEGEKAPVIVFVHGGPKGMYGYRFEYMMQHIVDEGFYVVYFNPRGSSGYSEGFALRVLQRTGFEDFQDIMNGIEEFLKIEPQADGDRIGITGISYGGFMTNWAITQTNRFKAAVSENGVSNWISMYGFSDISLWFVKEIVGEDPFNNENYKKLSPFFQLENVETPVLIIHSLEDYRCPLDQSVMMYHALRDLGKEAYIAVFKKGAHGHSKTGSPRHRSKRHKLIVEFFKRKLVENKEGFPVREILGEKVR